LAIAVLSLVPGQERPHTGLSGETEHFLAYACTGLVSSFAYLRSRERVLIWAGLAGASIAFEVLQNWIPGRIADVPDAIASTLGVTAGLLAGARLAAVILKQSRPLKRKAPPGAG
jgi:VanZ family protein